MSGDVLLNLLSIFSIKLNTKCNPSHPLSKLHQISRESSPTVISLQIFLFSIAFVTDVALWSSIMLFTIQWDVFKQPEALHNNTLSKLRYPISKL